VYSRFFCYFKFFKNFLGVTETGLFLNVIDAAYFATPEGEIKKATK